MTLEETKREIDRPDRASGTDDADTRIYCAGIDFNLTQICCYYGGIIDSSCVQALISHGCHIFGKLSRCAFCLCELSIIVVELACYVGVKGLAVIL